MGPGLGIFRFDLASMCVCVCACACMHVGWWGLGRGLVTDLINNPKSPVLAPLPADARRHTKTYSQTVHTPPPPHHHPLAA